MFSIPGATRESAESYAGRKLAFGLPDWRLETERGTQHMIRDNTTEPGGAGQLAI